MVSESVRIAVLLRRKRRSCYVERNSFVEHSLPLPVQKCKKLAELRNFMIISASVRTDIPALYADWFGRQLQAGYVEVRNPFNGNISRLDLSPDAVTAFQFWTRNPAPFFGQLQAVQARGNDFALTMTITGYPRALEAATPARDKAVEMFWRLADRFGPDRLVWRYDPVLISSLTPAEWHMDNMARLADALAGATDEVVLSFAQIYQKSQRNLDKAAARYGFSWQDPADADKKAILAALAEIARSRGFTPTLCSQPDLLVDGLRPAACIDGARFARFLPKDIPTLKGKAPRPGCACLPSRDIGFYDSCSQGCAYCYAVRNVKTAKSRVQDMQIR